MAERLNTGLVLAEEPLSHDTLALHLVTRPALLDAVVEEVNRLRYCSVPQGDELVKAWRCYGKRCQAEDPGGLIHVTWEDRWFCGGTRDGGTKGTGCGRSLCGDCFEQSQFCAHCQDDLKVMGLTP